MGNHKFRFSDMIPHAWFFKLKDLKRTRSQSSSLPSNHQKNHHDQNLKANLSQTISSNKPNISQPRQSHYYSRDPIITKPSPDPCFLDSPRTSFRRRSSRRKTIYRPSPTSEFDSDSIDVPKFSSSTVSSPAASIIYEVTGKSQTEFYLPPILTKLPGKFPGKSRNADGLDGRENGSLCIKTRSRKSISQSTGVKLRGNSPRMNNRQVQSRGRKSSSAPGKRPKNCFSGSFPVVKASFDPEKDFRESMIEMIVENKIRNSKDLEELLACYLSLNCEEYHSHIIEAFQQIWFNLSDMDLYKPK
ncbi:unnamed protein product [Cuscuta epithymum]|uniref:Transcription repressor n=1 Tax=Cuscuta epithymum TaxID=186058 RepID=A0AAV0FIF5_9ASTE|nr:unnamed protein product [Cuscuta epithymum]